MNGNNDLVVSSTEHEFRIGIVVQDSLDNFTLNVI